MTFATLWRLLIYNVCDISIILCKIKFNDVYNDWSVIITLFRWKNAIDFSCLRLSSAVGFFFQIYCSRKKLSFLILTDNIFIHTLLRPTQYRTDVGYYCCVWLIFITFNFPGKSVRIDKKLLLLFLSSNDVDVPTRGIDGLMNYAICRIFNENSGYCRSKKRTDGWGKRTASDTRVWRRGWISIIILSSCPWRQHGLSTGRTAVGWWRFVAPCWWRWQGGVGWFG